MDASGPTSTISARRTDPPPSSSQATVWTGSRRRWVGDPGLTSRGPSTTCSTSGRWLWPKTTTSASGNRRARRPWRPRSGRSRAPSRSGRRRAPSRPPREGGPRGRGRCCRARRGAGALGQRVEELRTGDVAGVQDRVGTVGHGPHGFGEPIERRAEVGVGDDEHGDHRRGHARHGTSGGDGRRVRRSRPTTPYARMGGTLNEEHP